MTIEEVNEQIKTLATKEFLETLTEVAKLYGWNGDYAAITSFISDIHKLKEIEYTIEQPYINE